jgi:hypothetical protein
MRLSAICQYLCDLHLTLPMLRLSPSTLYNPNPNPRPNASPFARRTPCPANPSASAQNPLQIGGYGRCRGHQPSAAAADV